MNNNNINNKMENYSNNNMKNNNNNNNNIVMMSNIVNNMGNNYNNNNMMMNQMNGMGNNNNNNNNNNMMMNQMNNMGNNNNNNKNMMMNQMNGMGNGNNNQNMANNNQNGNNMNNNFQNNNNNNNEDFMRIKHMPIKTDDDLYESIIENNIIFNNNEINEIKTIIETEYSSFVQYNSEDNYLSDLICEKLKDTFGGEWLVFVSNANDLLSFSISNYSNYETLLLRFGNSRIQIAKIK
jgi:hypothetical protein